MQVDKDFVERIAADANHLAVLGVTRRDGTIHASLVSAGVVALPSSSELAVGVVVSGDALKLRLVRRVRRAVAVFHAGFKWVAVEGPVTIAGPDDLDVVGSTAVPALLQEVFIAAGGSHDDWAVFHQVMSAERRAAVYIRMERITTNG